MEPTYVGCEIACGQIATANELGCDPSEVGLDLNPLHAVSSVLKSTKKVAKKVPGVSPGLAAANAVLKSKTMETLHKVIRNPIVTTAMGPLSVPSILNLSLAAAKGGPKGALDAAKAELRNPARRALVKAVALVFPPIAPAAAGLEVANRVLDAQEKGSASDKAKAVAQIAATVALAAEGDSGAKKGLEYLNQAKALRLPKNAQSKLSNPRLAVCGAKDEESKGVWVKIHFYREGDSLCAIVYGVGGGEVEISRLSVNVRPIFEYVKRLHARLHAVSGVSVGASFTAAVKTAKKLGKAKLVAKAKATSKKIADKAKCKAMSPSSPVSNTALAVFAAAKKGVESVSQYKRVDGALKNTASAIKKYASVKTVLGKLPLAQKQAALNTPAVKKAVIDGIGAKIAAAKFIKSGGPAKVAALKKTATAAQKKFSKLATDVKSSNPATAVAAQKMARIVSISAKAREKVKSAASNSEGGMPGIVIGPRGRLVRGKFNRRTPAPGESAQVILTKLGLERGIFSQVSGSARADRYRRRLLSIRRLARVSGISENVLLGAVKKAAAKKSNTAKKRSLPPASKVALKAKIKALPMAQKLKLAHSIAAAKKKAAVKSVVKKAAVKKAVSKLPTKTKLALAKKLRAARKRRIVRSPTAPAALTLAPAALSPGPSPYLSPGGGGGGSQGGPSPYVNDPSSDDPYGPGGVPEEHADDGGREAPGYAEAYEEHDSLDESDYVEDDFEDTEEDSDDDVEDGAEEAVEEDLDIDDEAVAGLIACAGGF